MKHMLIVENKNNLKKEFLLLTLFLLFIQCFICQISIDRYKVNVRGQNEFIKSEIKSTKCLFNYSAYGAYGFRVMMKPSPLLPLFESHAPFSSDLIGTIDTGVRLRLDEPKVGPEIFKRNSGVDFSYYMIEILSLLVMGWSFFSFREKPYLQFLSRFKACKSVYLGIILSLIFYLSLFLISSFILVNLQFLLNGIRFSFQEVLFLALFYFLLFIFYGIWATLSSAIGAYFDFAKGAFITFFIWFLFILIWPGIFESLVSKNATRYIEKGHSIETKKLEILYDFETACTIYCSQFPELKDQKEAERKWLKNNWEAYVNKIDSIDSGVIIHTRSMAMKYALISLFNPVTFIKLANDEISSAGYRGYIDLQYSSKDKRKKFYKFIIDNRSSNKNSLKIEPFLSPREALIQARPHLPYYFIYGLLIQILYFALSLFLSYQIIKLSLNQSSISVRFFRPSKLDRLSNRFFKRKNRFSEFLIRLFSREIKIGRYHVCHNERNIVNLQDYNEHKFYYLLSQNKAIDNSLIYKLSKFKKNFVIVPSIHNFQKDLMVKDIFKIFSVPIPESFLSLQNKLYRELKKEEKATLILELTKHIKAEYIVFDRFNMELGEDFKNYFADVIEILRSGRTIIYITSAINDIINEIPHSKRNPLPKDFNW
ncbi:MAG: hypothetical protein ACM3SY_08380 [Candidatus Omnitrophota bacterium]